MKVATDVLVLTIDEVIDRRILNTVASLRESGLTARLVAPRARKIGTAPEVGIQIEESDLPRSPLSLQIYEKLRQFALTHLSSVRPLVVSASGFLFNYEKLYLNTFRALNGERHSRLVIANDLPALPAASRFAAESRAKLVYDSHEFFVEQEFTRAQKRQWQRIEQKYIAHADAVVTVNESIREELEKRYGLPKVHVVMNAENPLPRPQTRDEFAPHCGPDKKVVLYQGSLSTGRFLPELAEVARYINDESVVFVFLGNGPEETNISKVIGKFGLQERVFVVPAVAQEKLLGFTASAYLGVIPYQANCLNNLFCTPNKMFEFIAAGLPFVGTDLPEIKKMVQKYDIGLVGPTDTPLAMASLIKAALDDTKRYGAWKKNILRAQNEVSWANEGEKFVRVVKDLLAA